MINRLPYQFNGLGIISTVLFVFDIVLFSIFSATLVLRLVLFPAAVVKSCTTNITELAMTGAVPIAWFTVTAQVLLLPFVEGVPRSLTNAQVGLTASNARWGGHPFTILAIVMWWLGSFVMMADAVFVIVVVARKNVVNLETMPPAMVLPFVGTTTDAVVGALIVQHSADMSARLAIPIIVVSYMLAGVGFFAAMMIYSAFFVKLMNHDLPPSPQSPSLILLVGPCGQSAAAILLLGTAARTYFGSYDRGTLLQASAGDTLAAVGVLLGLLFVGMACFFTTFAVYIMLEAAFRKEHKYSLLWWSTIFPLATVNTAWIALAEEMDSPAFRVLATMSLLVLVIAYIINWGFTLHHIATGRLLNGKRSDHPAQARRKES